MCCRKWGYIDSTYIVTVIYNTYKFCFIFGHFLIIKMILVDKNKNFHVLER